MGNDMPKVTQVAFEPRTSDAEGLVWSWPLDWEVYTHKMLGKVVA